MMSINKNGEKGNRFERMEVWPVAYSWTVACSQTVEQIHQYFSLPPEHYACPALDQS